MPDPKKKTKKTDENCNKEATDNYKGCLATVCGVKGWESIEVKDPGKDEAAGVVIGEPRFIEFVHKALINYMTKTAFMEMMKDVLSGEKENEPTKH